MRRVLLFILAFVITLWGFTVMWPYSLKQFLGVLVVVAGNALVMECSMTPKPSLDIDELVTRIRALNNSGL